MHPNSISKVRVIGQGVLFVVQLLLAASFGPNLKQLHLWEPSQNVRAQPLVLKETIVYLCKDVPLYFPPGLSNSVQERVELLSGG